MLVFLNSFTLLYALATSLVRPNFKAYPELGDICGTRDGAEKVLNLLQ